MNCPVISVILPVYNAEDYVANALDSILAQTFTDFELILIDDGSTDESLSILQQYNALDSRIILISRENRGLVTTLNEAIDLARGEFIARMDADDIAVPARFSVQIDFLKKHGYDICGASVQCFGQGEFLWRYPKTLEEIESQLLFDTPYAHPVVTCRAEILKTLKYSHNYPSVEDFDLWQRMWMTGAKGANLNEVLLQYRLHDRQVSRIEANQQQRLANKVRHRHWLTIAGNDHSLAIEQLMKIFTGEGGSLADIAPLLHVVAMKYSGAARARFMDHAFRLAVKAAATSVLPWSVWRNFLAECGGERKFRQEVILFIVWLLRLGPQSQIYRWFKLHYLARTLR